MSSGKYSITDRSQTMEYHPKDQGDKAEREETEVCVEDDLTANQRLSKPQEGGQKTQPGVKKQTSRAATLCKGLLCFLMIAVIVTLTTSLILEINDLTDKQRQLLATLLDLTVNTSQLQSSYERLNENHTQLLDRVMQHKQTIEGLKCPKGWTRFGCHFYFRSTEKKTWAEGRKHCQENGADLVIINAKEEQTFLADFNVIESWIGLSRTPGDKLEWKWVDGSPLVERDWANKLPASRNENQNSAFLNSGGKWMTGIDFTVKNWICEK